MSNGRFAESDMDACAQRVENKYVDIQSDKIAECVYSSFANGNKSNVYLDDTKLLKNERDNQLLSGVLSYPTLIVNG